MQRKTLTNALGNVQRGLLLPGGASGAWSPQAQVRLENFLLKPLMKTKANTPALPGSQPLAIEDKAPLTIEDKAPANASSSSDSSSDSSSSSDDSDAEQLAVDQGPASSAAAAPAEPVPMDVPVATQLIQAKEDFESIFAALHACQADLREAHQKIAEKEFQIAEKDSQIAMLERQLAEYQSETDDDALMTEDWWLNSWLSKFLRWAQCFFKSSATFYRPQQQKKVRERLLCHGCPFMVATLGYTWLYNYEVIISEEAIPNLYEKLNNLALEVYCYGGAVAWKLLSMRLRHLKTSVVIYVRY